MYYCKTKDVKEAENKLLGLKDWENNKQKNSNAQNKKLEGYVYVILSK